MTQTDKQKTKTDKEKAQTEITALVAGNTGNTWNQLTAIMDKNNIPMAGRGGVAKWCGAKKIGKLWYSKNYKLPKKPRVQKVKGSAPKSDGPDASSPVGTNGRVLGSHRVKLFRFKDGNGEEFTYVGNFEVVVIGVLSAVIVFGIAAATGLLQSVGIGV